MSKASRRLRRGRGGVGKPYVAPFPRCSVASDGIHRDGKKCGACGHHHCWRCRMCARCRAKNLTSAPCFVLGVEAVP